MSSPSFDRMATVTASTKRMGYSGGSETGMATFLASLKCMPLDPVDPETRMRMAINTPHELLQTVVDGALDVAVGDHLVVGAKEYPVKSVAEWPWGASDFRVVIVEELKR